MRAIDVFRDSEFHPLSTKGTTAIKVGLRPSERCHGEEVERAFSPLQELVHLVRLYEEHDTGSQRDLLAVQDHDPVALGHDQLVIPFVTMHGGIPALSNDELVHRGLSRSVFAADERFHLLVVAAFRQKANRGYRAQVGRQEETGYTRRS